MWYVKPKDELYHHGIKGQKWGVRRFQNPDGSYTEEGRKRYGGNVVNINRYDPSSVKKGAYGYEQMTSLKMGRRGDNVKVKIDLHDDATGLPISKESAKEYFNRINKLTQKLSTDDTEMREAIADYLYTSDLNMSKSKFMDTIKPIYIETNLFKDGRQRASVTYDDANIFGGHILEAIVDLKSGNVDYIMMEG